MKSTKLYLLLIAMAFLTFSCDEDDDNVNDAIYLSEYNPSDFMFQDDVSYVYQTYYDDYSDSIDTKLASWALKTNVIGKYDYDNKMCYEFLTIEVDLVYTNYILKDDRYLYNIGLRIVNNDDVRNLPHDTNSYTYYDTLIDFNKNKWTVADVNYKYESENEGKYNIFASGEYIGTKDIYIENMKYKAIGVLIKSNYKRYTNDTNSIMSGIIFNREEEMYFVKGIGFVEGISEESYTYGFNGKINVGKGKYEVRLVNFQKESQ